MAHSANKEPFKNSVVQWIDERLPVFTFLVREYGVFPMPRNCNYLWSFGGIAMTMLGIMIVTGVLLAMSYTPHSSMAFESVERIMRDVNYGWLLRYVHMNGASFFFIAVYIHIGRGLYYGSYKKPRELLWIFGVVLFLLMMATAFMGYALPWSQMSGWGVTVITSLFSAFPLIGDGLVTWLWGGFSVDNPTLNRFYALHFLLPFVIAGVVFIHVWALHVTGSNNPTGVEPKSEKEVIPFNPYFSTKDSYAMVVFLAVFFATVFFAPLALSEADHFREYDAMVTPPHIVPEWYFLPFYAILRAFTVDYTVGLAALSALGLAGLLIALQWMIAGAAEGSRRFLTNLRNLAAAALAALVGLSMIVLSQADVPNEFMAYMQVAVIPAKLQGVLAMFGSIILLFFLPWLDFSPVKSARYRPVYKWCLALLLVSFVALGYAGSQLPEGLPVRIGQMATAYYFLHFLVLVPYLACREKTRPVPASISDDPCCK